MREELRFKASVRPARCRSTERAPWIRSMRTEVLPRFEIPRSLGFPPVEYCRGTRPKKAASSCPERKTLPSPIAAIRAVAVSGPTPGIVMRRCDAGSKRASCPISPLRRSMCAPRPASRSRSCATSARMRSVGPFSASSRKPGTAAQIFVTPVATVRPYSRRKVRIGS